MRLRVGLSVAILCSLALVAWGVRFAWMDRDKPGENVASRGALIEGRVFDDDGPVRGARVRVKGRGEMVLTDELGRFRLSRPKADDGVVTAAKVGYFIAGISFDSNPLSLKLRRLPAKDAADYCWVDPAPDAAAEHNCANCHEEIYREWKSSGHARSATGRRFRNLHDGTDWNGKPGQGWSLAKEYPLGLGVCVSCHAPSVSVDEPVDFDLRQVRGVPAEGVHCDYCHKIKEIATGNVGLTHGRDALTLLRPAEGQLFFGPLDDVDRGEDAFLPLQQSSRFCASCHEGVVFGVHVYSTYSEWLVSPAKAEGKQCQTCHMAPTGRMHNVAPGFGGIERDPATLASHSLLSGGRAAMLRRCLDVDVQLERRDQTLHVRVDVEACNVGHRVPTGFIDRHLILVVEAMDDAGRGLEAKSGPILPKPCGSFAGRRGRLFAKLLLDNDGRGPIPFWRPAAPPRDTRLLPRKPVRSEFSFPAAARQIRVRLIYRRFWEQTARSKKWPDADIEVVDLTLPANVGED